MRKADSLRGRDTEISHVVTVLCVLGWVVISVQRLPRSITVVGDVCAVLARRSTDER